MGKIYRGSLLLLLGSTAYSLAIDALLSQTRADRSSMPIVCHCWRGFLSPAPRAGPFSGLYFRAGDSRRAVRHARCVAFLFSYRESRAGPVYPRVPRGSDSMASRIHLVGENGPSSLPRAPLARGAISRGLDLWERSPRSTRIISSRSLRSCSFVFTSTLASSVYN